MMSEELAGFIRDLEIDGSLSHSNVINLRSLIIGSEEKAVKKALEEKVSRPGFAEMVSEVMKPSSLNPVSVTSLDPFFEGGPCPKPQSGGGL